EKNVKEWETLDQASKDQLSEAVERARKALKQSDLAEIQAASEALQQAYSAAGAQMYQAQAASSGPEDAGFSGGATGGAGFADDETARATPSADGDVVDADYEIV